VVARSKYIISTWQGEEWTHIYIRILNIKDKKPNQGKEEGAISGQESVNMKKEVE